MAVMLKSNDAAGAGGSPMTPHSISEASPSLYKDFFPHEEILRINMREYGQIKTDSKRRPIYFGTIYVRDGRESAIVKIEGRDWHVSVHGRHINRAFSGDRVAVRLLPRGHWLVKAPPVLDLNYESPNPVTEQVDSFNVVVVFDEMPEDQHARNDTQQNLMQLLCDDGFAPSHSGWMSFNTVYVTVTAGFTSVQDLNRKLSSSRRKIVKPANVRSIQLFTEKPHDTASTPMATISAFSDDVASASPMCSTARSLPSLPSHPRPLTSLFCCPLYRLTPAL